MILKSIHINNERRSKQLLLNQDDPQLWGRVRSRYWLFK